MVQVVSFLINLKLWVAIYSCIAAYMLAQILERNEALVAVWICGCVTGVALGLLLCEWEFGDDYEE